MAQDFLGAVAGGSPAARPVLPDHVGQLAPDGKQWVQSRRGILEDHRDLAAADALQLSGRAREQVGSVEDHAATVDAPWLRYEPHHGLTDHRLARAALTDDGDALPRRQVE